MCGLRSELSPITSNRLDLKEMNEMTNILCIFLVMGGPIALLFIGQAFALGSACRRHLKNGDNFRTAWCKANSWR
jgi:hypothetical protein